MRVERIHAGHILGAGAVLGPVLGVFAPNFIALLAIAIVLLLAGAALRREAVPPLDRGFVTVGAIILVWSALSLFWTVDLVKAVEKWAAVFVVAPLAVAAFAVVKTMPPAQRRVVEYGAVAGALAGLLLIVFEVATDGFLSRFAFPGRSFSVELFNRSPSTLLIFLWPAMAVLWTRSPFAALSLAGLGLFVGKTLPSEGALVGFVVGLTVFIVTWFAARLVRWGLMAAVVLGVMLSPVASVTIAAPDAVRDAWPRVNASLLHRLQIWEFTSRHIAEKPLAGWGFNAARAIPGGDERYSVKDRDGRVIGQGDRLPLHPHNGALQVWLELGLPGALVLAAFLALAVYRAGAIADLPKRAIALGMLSTMIPIWMFSFGIWQGWWLGVLMLGALSMMATTVEVSS